MKYELNKNQKEAVDVNTGPCLVLSGPGSGKTFVLTSRIYNLIMNYKVRPSNILIITFTRAAACEMKERFLKIVSAERLRLYELPHFGTFHSIFFEILRNDFGYSKESLVSEDEEKRYLIDALNKCQFAKDRQMSESDVYKILREIDEYKLCREREESFYPGFVDKRTFNDIYRNYQDELYNHRKLDFYDMIDKCLELLSKNIDILKKYQESFRYVLIDEFQDINKSQYELVKLICKTKNLFVVGDDDQSIYRFRGSSPLVMREFLKDYKMTRKIYLNENYRCAKVIVKFSKKVIDFNKSRFKKDLIAKRDEIGSLEIKAFVDTREENEYIIKKIKEYIESGIKLSDIAILYRTNILANSVIQSLERNKIPYIIKGKNDIDITDENAIKLMTFHLSKGLEFKTVFIIDANDGLVPHKKSILDDDIETERRLFYVAMTRAKSNLHIFFTLRRFGKDFKASRFILEAVGGENGKKR